MRRSTSSGARLRGLGGFVRCAALQVELAEGNWQAEWVDPSTGKIVLTTRVDGGGVRAINPPSYETDIALRLRLAAPDKDVRLKADARQHVVSGFRLRQGFGGPP